MKVVKIIIDDKETKALNVNEQNINLLIKIIELFEVDIHKGNWFTQNFKDLINNLLKYSLNFYNY